MLPFRATFSEMAPPACPNAPLTVSCNRNSNTPMAPSRSNPGNSCDCEHPSRSAARNTAPNTASPLARESRKNMSPPNERFHPAQPSPAPCHKRTHRLPLSPGPTSRLLSPPAALSHIPPSLLPSPNNAFLIIPPNLISSPFPITDYSSPVTKARSPPMSTHLLAISAKDFLSPTAIYPSASTSETDAASAPAPPSHCPPCSGQSTISPAAEG